MKKLAFLLVFVTLLCQTTLHAQPTATPAKLQKHNLQWIKSDGDFNQSKLTKDQVDAKIDELIKKAADAGTLNEKIEIPFNKKMLTYVGQKHPNDTGLFDAYKIGLVNSKGEKNTPEIDSVLHIYKYGDFYFSTANDKPVDQQNVYYAIRAINILRVRYPNAFNTLFLATQSFATQTPQFNPWVNSNKAFWIAFNHNPNYIASNRTAILGDGYFASPNNTIGKYRNVSLVNINSRNILGDLPTLGTRPIYNRPANWENYQAYMREGLLESIAHEMCHNYIDLAFSYDSKINKIATNRGKPDFIYAEEDAVLNTSIPYFTKHGGFSTNLATYYYRETFEPNLGVLRTNNLLEQYAEVFSDTPINPANARAVFVLPILTN